MEILQGWVRACAQNSFLKSGARALILSRNKNKRKGKGNKQSRSSNTNGDAWELV